jgi:hypothetical protein
LFSLKLLAAAVVFKAAMQLLMLSLKMVLLLLLFEAARAIVGFKLLAAIDVFEPAAAVFTTEAGCSYWCCL